MKETYLNNLSKELDAVNAINKDEIIEKYRKRYDFGIESGLTEEEIESKLGNPSDIAKEYKNEDSNKNSKTKKEEFKKNFNFIIHTINDSVNIISSKDDKIHIRFDFDDYENYNVINNDNGVKVDYYKSKYFALNRKKPGEITVELPDNIMFDLVELTSASGKITINKIHSNRLLITTTSGAHYVNDVLARSISFTSVGGQITGNKIKAEKVAISSVSGKIEIDEIISDFTGLDTISGDIIINKSEGRLNTSSITGNTIVNGVEYDNLKQFVKGVFKK